MTLQATACFIQLLIQLAGLLAQGLDLFERLTVDRQGRIVTGGVEKTVHLAHRAGALLTLLYLGWLALRTRRQQRLRSTAYAMITILVLQVALGSTAVLAGLPLLLVTAHNGLAAILLLSVVNLNHLVTPTR